MGSIFEYINRYFNCHIRRSTPPISLADFELPINNNDAAQVEENIDSDSPDIPDPILFHSRHGFLNICYSAINKMILERVAMNMTISKDIVGYGNISNGMKGNGFTTEQIKRQIMYLHELAYAYTDPNSMNFYVSSL